MTERRVCGNVMGSFRSSWRQVHLVPTILRAERATVNAFNARTRRGTLGGSPQAAGIALPLHEDGSCPSIVPRAPRRCRGGGRGGMMTENHHLTRERMSRPARAASL